MKVFEDLGLSTEILDAIKKLGFNEPTKIQADSIPLILQGKDVIGESATGSGKTLAFGIGMIEKAIPGQGIQALVLTPTRELTEQIKKDLRTFSIHKKLRIVPVYGGVSIERQMDELTRAEIVVATPGRLLDHLGRGTIDLSKVKVFVLDEADAMLEMGFIEDVSQIIEACPKERQTMCFSATMYWEIKQLADKYMEQPTEVTATKMVDPTKLKQMYFDVARNMKLSLLVHLLNGEKEGMAMIFCNSRKTTDFVVQNLKSNGIRSTAIHGGMSQNKRLRTIDLFNKGRAGALVCTDVAARGLHIDNVSQIFNYEVPKDARDYVHRIGRTARAGEEGTAINLLCDYDYDNFNRVLDTYPDYVIDAQEAPQVKRVMVAKVEDRPQGRFGGNRSGHGRGSYQSRSYGQRRWS